MKSITPVLSERKIILEYEKELKKRERNVLAGGQDWPTLYDFMWISHTGGQLT